MGFIHLCLSLSFTSLFSSRRGEEELVLKSPAKSPKSAAKQRIQKAKTRSSSLLAVEIRPLPISWFALRSNSLPQIRLQSPLLLCSLDLQFDPVQGMAEEATAAATGEEEVKSSPAAGEAEVKKQRKGILSRIWRGLFGAKNEDYEKRLKYLSKEEASVHARMKRRAQTSRKMVRNLIVLSVMVEVVAVVYAIMTTRSIDLNWQMRAVRVLPIFVLPGLSSLIYSALIRFTRMLDRKDQKTLESLRAERKAKIDELKERTNYYTTQQLIQKYDLDPAAKAAAAAVLASKLGADSGLKVHVEDETKTAASMGKSNDVEMVQSNGLRNRKPGQARSTGSGNTGISHIVNEPSHESGGDGQEVATQTHKVVEHYRGPGTNDGGWIARIAALLVGEDPSQSYALICGNCRMHNGLARKEDFPYVTYFCPHCHALNTSSQSGERDLSSSSGRTSPLAPIDGNRASSVVAGSDEVHNPTTTQELPTGQNEGKQIAEAS